MSKLEKQDQGLVFRFTLYTGHTSKYDWDYITKTMCGSSCLGFFPLSFEEFNELYKWFSVIINEKYRKFRLISNVKTILVNIHSQY